MKTCVRLLMLATLVLTLGACGSDDSASVSADLAPEVDASQVSAEVPSASDPPVAIVTTPPLVVPTELATVTPVPSPTPPCLSVRQQAGQLLMALLEQWELPAAHSLAAAGELGAVGLLGSPDGALPEVLEALQRVASMRVMVASDEEGGPVQRLAALLGPLPSAAEIAATWTAAEVRGAWADYGRRAKALGVDVILGPVLDVGAAPGIRTRSFGEDPALVEEMGGAVAAGLLDAEVMPVFKHFPGHGRASADSHLTLPTTPGLADLRAVDLVPYEGLLRADDFRNEAGVMVAHLTVPGLSPDLPTSLSPATYDELRRAAPAFEGLVFSDAINMGAVANSYPAPDAAERALRAGADIVILGGLNDVAPVVDHLTRVATVDVAFADLLGERSDRVLQRRSVSPRCG